ncbi:hypothetical protein UY3_00673 [Chelonia mydas]|uniref:Uncharacterized protein n=1 Tax=Chelonia mydas TaxID=8469 RepID=M7CLM0_CHEMY|nr:hypothetical protein UY3_00673 [Chelonia mydas]
MSERGRDRDTLQCRVKVKKLQNAHHKVREANRQFCKELDAILNGDPTSTVKANVDTSVVRMPLKSGPSQEEEILDEDVEGDLEAEDNSEVRDACSQELSSTQEEATQSQLSEIGEVETGEEAPVLALAKCPVYSTVLEHLISPAVTHHFGGLVAHVCLPGVSRLVTVQHCRLLEFSALKPVPLQFSPVEVQYPLHCTPKKKVA